MSEFLVCYDCGSVRDPEYHAGHDCKTLCRLRAELAAAKAERDELLDLLREWNKIESHAEADMFEDKVLAALVKGKR